MPVLYHITGKIATNSSLYDIALLPIAKAWNGQHIIPGFAI